MNFGKTIYEYKDEILKDLKTLLEFKSVASWEENQCTEVLDFMLEKAESFGLVTKNIQNKAGHVQLGDKGKLCGVLTHLDVVPDGKNWTVEPFTLTEKDGRLYGRGIADDKGAALVSLYCLKALKDKGIEGNNTLRCIFGTDEEVGMTDMKTYFENEPIPDYSFTPDSDYGICYAEKGILQVEISMERNDGRVLNAIKAGNVINAVPDEAKALLSCSEDEADELLKISKKVEGNFKFTETIDGIVVESYGTASHAMQPEKGFNAATALVKLLSKVFSDKDLGSLCSFIKYEIGCETNGVSLGIQMRDFVSGDLTCNLGKIRLNDNSSYLTLDIRYPVTMCCEKIMTQIEKAAALKGLKAKMLSHAAPLYLPKESTTIQLLSGAYKEVMGEEPDLYSTGGGTYARKLGGNGVAFGPAFKDDNVNMHNADESMDKENFLKHCEICLEAMYRMYTEKL